MSRVYELPDEPRPGAMAHTVVAPFWPLLASMLAGSWLGWPWFVWNGFAMRSPTRRRELFVVVGGLLLGPAVLIAAVVGARFVGAQGTDARPYVLLAVVLWKLAVSYWLYALQGRTFELYRHYGGIAAQGLPVVLLGYFAARFVGPQLRALSPFLELFLR